MPRSSPRGRLAVVLVASLSLGACASTAAPSVAPTVPLPSAPATSLAPSGSAAPTATPTQVPAPTPTPAATPEPTDSPAPTNPPDPTSTPNASPIAGCGTGEVGFAAHRQEIPTTLAFGHATIEFTPAGTSMRDGSWDADDVIPEGVGLTPDEIAVVVAPGDHILLRATGLTLLDAAPAASAWSKVTFQGGLASFGGTSTGLASRIRSDGSLSISAPTQVGDWAVQLMPHWRGTCLQGDGTAYARIKVR